RAVVGPDQRSCGGVAAPADAGDVPGLLADRAQRCTERRDGEAERASAPADQQALVDAGETVQQLAEVLRLAVADPAQRLRASANGIGRGDGGGTVAG